MTNKKLSAPVNKEQYLEWKDGLSGEDQKLLESIEQNIEKDRQINLDRLPDALANNINISHDQRLQRLYNLAALGDKPIPNSL